MEVDEKDESEQVGDTQKSTTDKGGAAEAAGMEDDDAFAAHETNQSVPNQTVNTEHSVKTIEPTVEEPKEQEDLGNEPAAEGNSIEDQMSKNDAVYKSVEIDKEMMVSELNRLRGIFWEVQETIYNTYDFGLLHLDCRSYKQRLLTHC